MHIFLKRLFSSVALLLLVTIFLQAQPANNATVNTQKPDLKVLSWNIHMLPYFFIYHKTKKRTRARGIGTELAKLDYDIIVFQEAFRAPTRRIIKKRLKKLYPHRYGATNYRYLTFKTNSGIWVFSKIPLKYVDEIKYSECSGTDCMARKGACLLEGTVNGNEFQLIGTHLQAGGKKFNTAQQKEIRKYLLDPYKKEGVPQIVCGDMNTATDNKTRYPEMLEILDVEDGPLNSDLQYTCGSKHIIDFFLLRKNGANLRIDRSAKIIGPAWKEGAKTRLEQIGLSDHYGVEGLIYFES